jgi:hypothetical protein
MQDTTVGTTRKVLSARARCRHTRLAYGWSYCPLGRHGGALWAHETRGQARASDIWIESSSRCNAHTDGAQRGGNSFREMRG